MSISNYQNFCFGPDQVLPASCFKTSEADGAVQIFTKETGLASEKPISIYSLFERTVSKFGNKPALAVKRNGVWRFCSYQEYFDDCWNIAKGLIKLGLERFCGVCIMGFNSPEWFKANFGVIFAGGLSTGLYTTNSPETCRYLAENCNAQIIFVEDTVCLDKILAVKRFLPNIKAIIQWDGEVGAPGVLSWNDLMQIGIQEPDFELRRRLSLAAVNQCCTLIYTSGTTGPPKGVMCSQDNLTWAAAQIVDLFDLGRGIGDESVISYLPCSHLAAQMSDMYSSLSCGGTVYFAQPDALKGSLGQTLQEVQPTQFFAVPRIWEKMHEKMQEVAQQNGFLKRTIANWAKYYGLLHFKSVAENRKLTTAESYKYSLAKSLILNKVATALGLRNALNVASGSAPISMELLEYFASLGIPIIEFYGMSESIGVSSGTFFAPGMIKFGCVGKVCPHNEVRLLDVDERREREGEICMKGRNICMGYLKMQDKTDETIDDDGWLHSGDIGYVDEEGFLHVTGRLKELVITAGGENIPPMLIENEVMKQLPFISNAVLIGDKRKYLSILLTLKSEIDPDTTQPLEELLPSCVEFLKSIGSTARTVSEGRREIVDLPRGPLARAIQAGIDRYNSVAISHAQKVQKWTILPNEFSIPTGELNNTLKLKRQFVQEKYSKCIDSMYDGNDVHKSKL